MRPILMVPMGFLCACTCLAAPWNDKAKVTIVAVDEEDNPVSNVLVGVQFLYGTKGKGWTDTNGVFALEGESGGWDTWYQLQKEGCYRSDGKYMLTKPEGGRWQPWNPVVTAVVRRIVNPIPMYAKRVETKIPAENKLMGFDLEAGEWTAPYGSGREPDIFFFLSRRITAITDYEGSLLVSFTNCFNGIVENHEIYRESQFRLPREAPLSGYQTNWMFRTGQNPTNGYFGDVGPGEDRSYLIRVRSKVDEKGQLKEANYGKISGLIRVRGVARKGSAELILLYYLNPTPNDRNLEFDPKRNLFQNLKSTERVNLP